MDNLIDRMTTRRAQELRLDIEERRRERERPPRLDWGSADGSRGAVADGTAPFQPCGPNIFSPQGGH